MRRMTMTGWPLVLGAALALAGGCDSGSTDDGTGGGKTDTPDGKAPAEEQCEDRRQDAIGSANKVFTETAIRWACSDVEGVNTVGKDDRGQEYCEYFAIIQPPPLEDGGDAPDPITTGQNLNDGSATELALSLTEDQQFWLEDNPDEQVGACVFTTWHQDIEGPLEVCGDSEEACPYLWGIPMTAENFRMKVSFNSNPAASDLVRQCFKSGDLFDPEEEDNPLASDFFRGCMMAAETYGTQWRRSDPAVCAASMRLKECGCSLKGDPDGDIPFALVPPQPVDDEITLRGFPLGTWTGLDQLPPGCEVVDIGETEIGSMGRNIVSCELLASDLLVSQEDPKGKCREKYGDNIVVHVPIPPNALECDPPDNGPYAETCGDTPWVIDN